MFDELINDIKTSIIRWYPFKKDATVIYLGDDDAVYFFLKERFIDNIRRYAIHDWMSVEECADYIICIKYAELLENVPAMLEFMRKRLSLGGRLILGMNNRLGIRYFCGDKDPHTWRCFDGIDDYFRAYRSPDDSFMGKSYDRQQLESMLEKAGFCDNKFYSVFSDLENASFIFADGYVPNEELYIRIFPTYNNPGSVFLEEEMLYPSLINNGLFHRMANAFLIECSTDASHSDALQITSSLERGRDNAMITIIHENNTVTKQAAFSEGSIRLQQLADNMQRLKESGVRVVVGFLSEGTYSMPYIKAETGMKYLKSLLHTDIELFLQRLDEFRDEILKSSDSYMGIYELPESDIETNEQRKKRLDRNKEPWETETMLLMKKGMVDMIPLNSLFVDGKFVFFDQEFCIDDFPLKAILWRMIVSVHTGTSDEEKCISRKELFVRYGIDPDDRGRFDYLTRIAGHWLSGLRMEKELTAYHAAVCRNTDTVNANRQRMNFSVDDYQRLFVDIFDKADTRKLIIFGSGLFAKRFMATYSNDYRIYAVVDNNKKRWGQKLYPEGYESYEQSLDVNSYKGAHGDGGIEIQSPELLNQFGHGEYKVIICIKSFNSVMEQLDKMGITEYSIFDPSKAYPRKRHPLSDESVEHFQNSTVATAGGKKYHVGYIAGVFDLYHVGHLNMFKRAKEMCDYLIVGVVSDEGVIHVKRTEPFVPFEERIEMVRSCRYVDEAVEIPYIYAGTEEAWKMHHFDVQFSGSDYIDDPLFARYKEFLEKHGATMEFFPYTQSTSSTKIKKLIDKKLL